MGDAIHAVTCPKWGLSMEEGEVVEWLVTEGAEVAEGDELLEIETSKINNVVEAPAAGRLRRIVASPGETVLVGQLVGVIAGEEVDDAALDAWVAEFQASFVPAAPSEGGGAGPQQVEVEGRTLSVLAAGPTDASTVVVLLHGFGGDANGWMFNQSTLAGDRRVYALDLPGHGGSSKEVGKGTIAELARSVTGFLDALGIGRAHLVGHSLGGAIALEIASTEPARVTSLALIAPAGLGERIDGDYVRGFVDGRSRRDMKPVLARLVADPKRVTREMVEDVLRYKRLDGVGECLATIASAVFPDGRQAVSHRDTLDRLDVPVTIVWGERDAIADPKDAGDLPPDVAVHVLPDTGHMPHMEASNRVNEILDAHLRSALD